MAKTNAGNVMKHFNDASAKRRTEVKGDNYMFQVGGEKKVYGSKVGKTVKSTDGTTKTVTDTRVASRTPKSAKF